MRAALLASPAPVTQNPLQLVDIPAPAPKAGQVLIRVNVCGACRTDLHVVEGELPHATLPVVPGHQVVGEVVRLGPGCTGRVTPGTRTGVAWLHRTCGQCEDCLAGRENLCESAIFTGYTANGGFAEYIVAPEDFVYPLPPGFADLQAAPLLCAGIIGFRCLRLSSVTSGMRLGLYGFGAAAHVAIQVARYWGASVYVCTRDERHRELALELGAAWAGGASDPPPVPLDAAIIFAPAGELVPAALLAVRRGGTVTLGGIHMSDIPSPALPPALRRARAAHRRQQYPPGRPRIPRGRSKHPHPAARGSPPALASERRPASSEARCDPRRPGSENPGVMARRLLR